MVCGIQSTREHSDDVGLPAFIFRGVGEVTADWLKPDQWVVYWFDCVLKGYSHRVLGNLFLALGQDSRWWKQLPPFFFFSRV